jgi:hypothetical protein
MSDKQNKRFKIPLSTMADIDTIDEDSIVDEEAFRMSAEIEPGEKEREKIVELLRSLRERTGNSYADRKKAEFTVARLRAMGIPVDGFYNMLGQNFNPEMIAGKMLEERDEESGPDEPEAGAV